MRSIRIVARTGEMSHGGIFSVPALLQNLLSAHPVQPELMSAFISRFAAAIGCAECEGETHSSTECEWTGELRPSIAGVAKDRTDVVAKDRRGDRRDVEAAAFDSMGRMVGIILAMFSARVCTSGDCSSRYETVDITRDRSRCHPAQ